MPRASRKQIDKEMQNELQGNFSYLISALHSSKEIENFFEDFLTQEEKTMLAKRLMLHLMLENGYKSSEIAAVLNVSHETIRVHKEIWTRGGETYRKMIRKIAKREKTKEFWQRIEKILTPLGYVLHSNTSITARSKLLNHPFEEKK